VTDPNGQVIPGAKVTAKSETSGESREVTTGGVGEYRIESLTPGAYQVTVTATGFAQSQINNYQVQTSTVSSLNVTLSLPTATATVVVAEAVEQVQTDAGAISGTVPQEQIRNLPIPTGNLDQNGDGETSNDRPFLLNPAAKINYTDACINSPTCISGIGYLDPADGLMTSTPVRQERRTSSATWFIRKAAASTEMSEGTPSTCPASSIGI